MKFIYSRPSIYWTALVTGSLSTKLSLSTKFAAVYISNVTETRDSRDSRDFPGSRIPGILPRDFRDSPPPTSPLKFGFNLHKQYAIRSPIQVTFILHVQHYDAMQG